MVMCINNGAVTNANGNTYVAPVLEVGNIYTVIGTNYNGTGYFLKEVDCGEYFNGFTYKRFAPLSEIDEKEYNVAVVRKLTEVE